MDRTETTFDIDGGVATLTLARPEIRNAITGLEIIDEIVGAVEEAEQHPQVSVLVVTGAGSAFSAGGNVKDMRDRTGMFAGSPDELSEGYRSTIQRIPRAMASTDLATLAAVNGAAVGAGFDLALMCDMRIGAESARFAHTFVDLGIIPGDGGAWFLPRVVGWQRAAELAFTGRMIDAREALTMDILMEVVPADRLLARAGELAAEIAAKPPHSIRLAKRLLRHARTMDLAGFLDMSAAYQALSHHTDDHLEAMEAFFDQRRGRFSGH